MRRVLKFMKTYPKGHILEGQPTYFVEKIWKWAWDNSERLAWDIGHYQMTHDDFFHPGGSRIVSIHDFAPKIHTIREGDRWEVGDVIVPQVWQGLPYRSKTITFLGDIVVKQVRKIDIRGNLLCIDMVPIGALDGSWGDVRKLAMNDGLTLPAFQSYFNREFSGQIIQWGI